MLPVSNHSEDRNAKLNKQKLLGKCYVPQTKDLKSMLKVVDLGVKF